MEKSAVAEMSNTIVPAAQEVAVVGADGIPMQPVILVRVNNTGHLRGLWLKEIWTIERVQHTSIGRKSYTFRQT